MLAIILYYLKLVLYYVIFMSCLNLLRSKIFEGKSIMIILGSGGHTGEILMMLRKLDFDKFNKIFLISAHNDKNSEIKAKEMFALEEKQNKHIQFFKVYRSRNVGQSYLTSIVTTLISLAHSFYLMIITRPNLIVTNGPGVAIPLCYIGYLYKKMQIIYDFQILFIESYCRTKSISLTGKLIEPITDRFIVLWRSLVGKNREFIGKIL